MGPVRTHPSGISLFKLKSDQVPPGLVASTKIERMRDCLTGAQLCRLDI